MTTTKKFHRSGDVTFVLGRATAPVFMDEEATRFMVKNMSPAHKEQATLDAMAKVEVGGWFVCTNAGIIFRLA
jgi:hypothetical protein